MTANPSIMILAGEASGDMHAAVMADELKQLLPDARLYGMGGQKMREAGVEIILDNAEIAVMGITEVIAKYPAIKKAQRFIEQTIRDEQPDLLILIDYVDFNLMVAKAAKQAGSKVLFFIPPKIWAWKAHRLDKMKKRVDYVATLFPFEVKYYEQAGIPVRYVGNPIVDLTKPSGSKEDIAQALGLNASQPIIGLLPGSRRMEIEKLMPLLVDCANQLSQTYPDAQFVLPAAPSVDRGMIDGELQRCTAKVTVLDGKAHDAMQVSDALIIASGTATLEAALIGTPMAVVYKTTALTYAIIRFRLLIDEVSLVNIVAEKSIVKELLQKDATTEKVCAEIQRILNDDDYRQTMRDELAVVKEKIGDGGGAKNVAHLAQEMLSE